MYNVPAPNMPTSQKVKVVNYVVPVNPPVRNPDERTLELIERNQESTSIEQNASMGVSINQTTAIRIDDSSVNVRESWSSAKIADFYQNTARVKFGTVETWSQQPTFVPEDGEFIIYTDRNVINGVEYPGIKMGDGNAYLVDLPFIGDDIANQILAQLNIHTSNNDIHVTAEKKQFWDNKLNYNVNGETLVFNRD